ncbi:MAG: DNA gyrase subunit A [Candidatus Nanoarchaeia archaeon]|nr:DNA gyrase subunit A [Candidatus Nanoarchaeia archaeon]|tara:strand:+ start:8976 stop:11363 length:2388 start_codon:yes stop_codon:yes gene_type:complete
MVENIQTKLIENEMKEAYVDYAMSVIIGRALPDVRDGLKPVHRRILYSMLRDNLKHDKPFRKSATTVGSVIGKFHPHGDQAIYDSLVRMAQDFSLRYPLIDGHGNFGSTEFEAAAHRYTEARLSRIAEELLEDIDKNTIDFVPNFDNNTKEPLVLPGKLPNLLINGSSGIAVGMTTNMPPHNITEVIDATIALVDNPHTTVDELMNHIKGPDFPTGGIILGKNGILEAYKTGRGKMIIRGKTEIKDNKIFITEIPYQLNKSYLIEDIAYLVKEKKVEGITDIRDESDKSGMSIVVETKKGSNPELILNQLYKYTNLQTSFGIINIALINNEPKLMNLKEIINHHIDHRKNVVTRRTKYELEKAEQRLHLLEGLRIALNDIDKVISLIKQSKDPSTAKQSLISNFNLTEIQSNAILEMRLQRLTNLEQIKIKDEISNLTTLIEELKSILSSDDRVSSIIKDELTDLKNKYSDERKTQITKVEQIIENEDLIKEEDIVITVTHSGYIKQTSLELYKQQRRGGKGIRATATKEDDEIQNLFITRNHNYLLFFTNKGRIHWLKAFMIPQANRYSKGKAIINLLNLKDEKINAILPIEKFDDQHYLLFVTKNGSIKKTSLKHYSKPRKAGINAVNLKGNDELVQVRLTPGVLEFIVATKKGLAMRFNERDIRSSGRNSSGVRGIRLINDEVVGIEVGLPNASLLTVTENGFGKRTDMENYRLIKRGGKGVRNIICDERNGNVIGIKTIKNDDEVMLISKQGIVIRIPAKDISKVGRNTKGVRLMRLKDDKVISIARVVIN